jgi:sugar lactone lactonase YvrE
MRNRIWEIITVSRRGNQRFGFRLRMLLFSAGVCALVLAQSVGVSTAGKKADTRGLWVPNALGNTIVEYTSAQRAASGSPVPALINLSSALNFPTALVFDPSGNMWVVNEATPSIIEFTALQLLELGNTSNPEPVVTVTSSGLESPLADFDRSGNLWVSDHDANEIFEFSKKQLKVGGDLTPKVTITSSDLDGARNLAFDHKGNLWISNDVSDQVEEFAKKGLAKGGTLTPAVILSDDGSGSLDNCEGIAFDTNHNLWVADADSNTIVEFPAASLKASGTTVPAVTIGATAGSLDAPVGIGFDDKGNLWVSNFIGDSVVEFSPAQITASGTPTPVVTISNNVDSLQGPEQFSFGE